MKASIPPLYKGSMLLKGSYSSVAASLLLYAYWAGASMLILLFDIFFIRERVTFEHAASANCEREKNYRCYGSHILPGSPWDQR